MTPHVEAKIQYSRSEDGGRNTPVHSGYRGQFHYKGEPNAWDAPQTFIDKEIVHPGETVIAHLTFLSPDRHRRRLRIGTKFEVREGIRLVGEGEVTKIFPELNHDADVRNESTT